MAIFRWGENWDPFRDLEREVDRLLQGVNISLQTMRSSRRFPPLNLTEYDDRFVLTAELPGVEIRDLELSAASGVLTMKGRRRPPQVGQADTFRRQERFQGEWERVVQLPEQVDEDAMRAEYTTGILTVTLPKAPATQPRSITVTEGPG